MALQPLSPLWPVPAIAPRMAHPLFAPTSPMPLAAAPARTAAPVAAPTTPDAGTLDLRQMQTLVRDLLLLDLERPEGGLFTALQPAPWPGDAPSPAWGSNFALQELASSYDYDNLAADSATPSVLLGDGSVALTQGLDLWI